jgi:hypothetical protein
MADSIRRLKPKKTEESNSRSTLIIVVAVVCVALAIGILAMVNSGGKSPGKSIVAQESSTSSGTSATSSAVTTAPVITAPALSLDQVLVPPLSIYRRRNPFRPLVTTFYQPSVPAGTGGAGVVTVPPELDQQEAGGNGNVLATQVMLEGVFEQNGKTVARVSVGDQVFDKLSVGDTFNNSYKLLDVSKDGSATILYGDERFTVYVGQSIYW